METISFSFNQLLYFWGKQSSKFSLFVVSHLFNIAFWFPPALAQTLVVALSMSTSANGKSKYTEKEISRHMGQVIPQFGEWFKSEEKHEQVAMGSKTSRSKDGIRKFIDDHERRIEGRADQVGAARDEDSERYMTKGDEICRYAWRERDWSMFPSQHLPCIRTRLWADGCSYLLPLGQGLKSSFASIPSPPPSSILLPITILIAAWMMKDANNYQDARGECMCSRVACSRRGLSYGAQSRANETDQVDSVVANQWKLEYIRAGFLRWMVGDGTFVCEGDIAHMFLLWNCPALLNMNTTMYTVWQAFYLSHWGLIVAWKSLDTIGPQQTSCGQHNMDDLYLCCAKEIEQI